MSRQYYISVALSALFSVGLVHLDQSPYFFLDERELEKIESTHLDGEEEELKKSPRSGNSFGTPQGFPDGFSFKTPLSSSTISTEDASGKGNIVPLYILLNRLKVAPLFT